MIQSKIQGFNSENSSYALLEDIDKNLKNKHTTKRVNPDKRLWLRDSQQDCSAKYFKCSIEKHQPTKKTDMLEKTFTDAKKSCVDVIPSTIRDAQL